MRVFLSYFGHFRARKAQSTARNTFDAYQNLWTVM